MATLDFATLVPERDKLEMGDGTTVEFLSTVEMDVEDMAVFKALQARAARVQTKMSKAATKNQSLELAREMNGVLGDILRRILPDLTDEQLAQLKMGYRSKIVAWWNEQNKLRDDNEGNADGRASTS